MSVIWVNAYNDVTDRLRLSMASLFLIVGLLVSYTAVSRLVREQVVSIGTKKALGLCSREIMLSYLLYSTLAVVVGIVLGALLATYVLEAILSKAALKWFSVDSLTPYFSLVDTLGIGAVELVLIDLASLFACRSMLRRQATDLLKGEEPPQNKTRFYEK